MPFAINDGARIYWREDGRPDAPPLLMVGSLGSDHSMWNPVMPALAERFRVIRVDKRGHGASDAPQGDYAMSQLGGDLLAVADAAGVQRFRYMGLSIGGMVGMWLLGNAPDRLERVVLTNTSARVDPNTFSDRIAAVRAGGMASIADTVMGRFFTPAYAKLRTVHHETVRQVLLALQPHGYIGCCTAIRDMRIAEALPRVSTPTLVVAGTYDVSTSAEQGRWIAQTIPGAQYLELPTAHFSPSEQPGRFVDAAVRFLLDDASVEAALDASTLRLAAIAQAIALSDPESFARLVAEGFRQGLDAGELQALIAHSGSTARPGKTDAFVRLATELQAAHESATRPS
ncbi:MAG: 3-oxoadipate enol-lactonase [Quisquiliibacterium sp.]